MKAIIGIGNPGEKYKHTRHNAGFMAVDAIKKTLEFDPKELLLVKPSTFVNKSGEAVRSLLDRHRFQNQDLLIVCDDVNLEFGKLRLRPRGSAGGHHGLESVVEAFGSGEFPRLRIGVARPAMPKNLTGFVLERFSAEEEKKLKSILEKVVLICHRWVTDGVKPAMDTLSRLQSTP
ncbi:MAG: hypothetical protein A3C47_00260 [Omnitrophica bacterium RIFCSPHIGHO2_02_FULL_51_18]|nr:MAG: hypothetical protein A3C47_00260 [Omnitrophica bacterium RIFCSPHIGHO2_02_FULL_51_18]